VSAKHRLRILSYNIHQGLTVHKKRLALSLLKDAIKAQKADVVLLQEVAGVQYGTKVPVRGGINSFQLEAFADDIWPYYAYGRNAVFSGGFHGNAILSRYPISKWENIDLTLKALQKGKLKKMMPKRGMLHAAVTLPETGRTLHILSTHFGLLQFERREQLKTLMHYVRTGLDPADALVIGGDFNDWREVITRRLAKHSKLREAFVALHSKHARSFPSRFPVLCLDRIYFRGLEPTGAHRLRGRPWHFLSDHLPLVADFHI